MAYRDCIRSARNFTVEFLLEKREGILGEANEGVGIDADDEGEGQGHGQGCQHAGGKHHLFLIDLVVHEHDDDHAEVVIEGDRRIEDSDDGQRIVFGLNDRGKQIVLSDKARGRWDPCE